MDVTDLTVRELTPPGYFNLSANASSITTDYVTWWNNILANRANDAVNLKQMILTPWLVDHNATPRTPWLQYLLETYGAGWFSGTNNQAAALYRLLSSAWSRSVITNITMILQTLGMAPFSWFTASTPGITVGNLVASLVDTGFLIYSTAGSAPSTPSNTTYAARAWETPSGFTRAASSATYYCRGYLSGGDIVWCAARPVSDFENDYVYSAAVPVAIPSAGTVAIVYDDSSGDISSIYYCDGTAWRKNSMPNADLGLVDPEGERPDPEAYAVYAPNPATAGYAIDSQVPPPSDGPTEGYGTFAGLADIEEYTDTLTVIVTQIAGGSLAIATIIELLRRIKPLYKSITLIISEVNYTISDARARS